MADLLGHKWMRGEVTKKEDFVAKYNPIMEQTLSKRDEDQEARDLDFSISQKWRGFKTGDAAIELDVNWATYNGRKFGPVISLRLGLQCITFTVLGEPLNIMKHLRDILEWYDEDADKKTLKLSKSAWKVKVVVHSHSQDFNNIHDEDDKKEEKASTDGPCALISAEMHEIEAGSKYLVSLVRKQGDGLVFAKESEKIKEMFKKT